MPTQPELPPRGAVIETLQSVPLFHGLEPALLADIAESLNSLSAAPGSEIFAEGAAGDAMFFIDSGTVKIHSGEGEHEVVLATLGPGQFFGEMALALGAPRTASATAIGACVLFVLPSAGFRQLVDRHPSLRSALSRVSEHRASASELFDNEAFDLVSLAEAEDRVSLGRDASNTIVLDWPGVAPFHAEIRRTEAGHRIVHLGSAGGTFRNQQRVIDAELLEGDLVRIGS